MQRQARRLPAEKAAAERTQAATAVPEAVDDVLQSQLTAAAAKLPWCGSRTWTEAWAKGPLQPPARRHQQEAEVAKAAEAYPAQRPRRHLPGLPGQAAAVAASAAAELPWPAAPVAAAGAHRATL
jgi:hypothetical protein